MAAVLILSILDPKKKLFESDFPASVVKERDEPAGNLLARGERRVTNELHDTEKFCRAASPHFSSKTSRIHPRQSMNAISDQQVQRLPKNKMEHKVLFAEIVDESTVTITRPDVSLLKVHKVLGIDVKYERVCLTKIFFCCGINATAITREHKKRGRCNLPSPSYILRCANCASGVNLLAARRRYR
ncbi:hypothetical protein H3H36_12975 [Duganella sp. FT3S]|uniref:Uncharacterized protein n=2 Tax=Rugamonas fusca TaxID=2758568 RepID=A0A7W2EI80_9BURK|nr:hypothetical protein [Rugamonas fusca]